MAASPDTDNLSILQAIVYFKAVDDEPESWTSAEDMGSVIKATLSMDGVETRQHLSRRTPVRSVDLETIVKKGAKIVLTCEEYTANNLKMAMAGGAMTGTTTKTFKFLGTPNQTGWIFIDGQNSIGSKLTFTAKVSVSPSGELDFISESADDYDNFDVTFTILADDAGDYGTFTITEIA